MRILWLKTELLHPVDKGGKIRTYQMLKELCAAHHVTYLTLDDGTASVDARERAKEYCHHLITVPHKTREKFSAGFYFELAQNLAARAPYAVKKYESLQMLREIERLAGEEGAGFDVLVCDFLAPSINVPAKLPCATVLFQHNVEAMIWKRHAEVQRSPLKKAYLSDQWRKMRAFEEKMCRMFDHVIAVSREDAVMMMKEYGVENVSDVPTGVDTEFFRPSGKETLQPHNLVFTGSMDWLPNEDAIRFFTTEIMPLVKSSVPDVRLTVVGRSPSQSLLEMSKRDASIEVTGRVEDVRPFIERAACYIVPIRIGGGTRLKIYEAMAMEKPIVSTRVGAEGLPVANGQEILLADEPEEFAASIVRVLKDKEFAASLGQQAARTVRERFGWRRVSEQFTEACERALARKRGQELKDVKASVEVEQATVS